MTGLGKKYLRVLSFVLAVVMAVACVNGKGTEVWAKPAKPVVVLYFSATGTTESVARKIKKSTGGQMIEIQAADPYTDEDLDWGEEDSRVTREHESASSPAKSKVRPKIRKGIP